MPTIDGQRVVADLKRLSGIARGPCGPLFSAMRRMLHAEQPPRRKHEIDLAGKRAIVAGGSRGIAVDGQML